MIMKRYRKNQIYRTISRNKTLIISGAALLASILTLILGVKFGTFSTAFFLVPICGFCIAVALIFFLPRTPWIAPWVQYWLNKEKIQHEIEVFKKVDNKLGLAISLISMGTLYGAVRKHEIELDYYLQALENFMGIQKDEGIALICQPIASIYEKYEEFSHAEHYFMKGLDFSKKIKDLSLVYDYNLLLGEFYEKQGIDDKAGSYYAEADKLKDLKEALMKGLVESIMDEVEKSPKED